VFPRFWWARNLFAAARAARLISRAVGKAALAALSKLDAGVASMRFWERSLELRINEIARPAGNWVVGVHGCRAGLFSSEATRGTCQYLDRLFERRNRPSRGLEMGLVWAGAGTTPNGHPAGICSPAKVRKTAATG